MTSLIGHTLINRKKQEVKTDISKVDCLTQYMKLSVTLLKVTESYLTDALSILVSKIN